MVVNTFLCLSTRSRVFHKSQPNFLFAMLSEVPEAGDNDGANEGELDLYKELRAEVARLKENDRERQERMKQLVKENENMREKLGVLERLLTSELNSAVFPKSSKSGKDEKGPDQGNMQWDNHLLTKTLVKLTCECIVINKKLKYLRRLTKMNQRKLSDTEKVRKIGIETRSKTMDKVCQVALSSDIQRNSVSVGTTTSQDRLEPESSDTDMLISDVFYLPTRPDLPDLRLFDLL